MKQLIFSILIFIFSFEIFAQNETQSQIKLIDDFYQTLVDIDTTFEKCYKAEKEGNCVTISLVKAALGTFKTLNNIYKDITSHGDSFFFKI